VDVDYGPPTPEHGVLAERRWTELAECLGLRHTPSGFPIRLRRASAGGGWIDNGRLVGGVYHGNSIEVLGDPTQVQSWKHEMMHYLLDVREGNPDDSHARGGLVVYGTASDGRPLSQGADWLRCTTRDGR